MKFLAVAMLAACIASTAAAHGPGVANEIEPAPFQDREDGKQNPADNGHAGVKNAQDNHGGVGNHPNTGTDFGGPNQEPDHPLD